MGNEAQSAAIDVEALKKLVGEQVTGAVNAAVVAALKPVTDQIGSLAAKVDPLAGLVTDLQKSHASLTEQVSKAPKGLSADEVQKLLDAGVTKTLDAKLTEREQTEAAAKKKQEVRGKVLAAKGLDKIDATLTKSLPDTDNEEELTKAADALVKVLNTSGVKLPDVGGANKDGGESAAAAAAKAGTKPEGGFLKMPGAPA